MTKILVLGLVLFASAVRAGNLEPLPPEPDYRPAKKAVEAAFARLLRRYAKRDNPTDEAVRGEVAMLQGFIRRIEGNEKAALKQESDLLKTLPTAFAPTSQLLARARYSHAAKMMKMYGSIAPVAINEELFAAKGPLAGVEEPGFPLKKPLSDDDSYQLSERIGEHRRFICSIDRKFFVVYPDGKTANYCDGRAPQ